MSSQEIQWGASSVQDRGYVLPIGDTDDPKLATANGNYHGPYSTYHAMGHVRGLMNGDPHLESIRSIKPEVRIGPFGSWVGEQIASIDPFGATATQDFPDLVEHGIRSTITIIRNRFVLDPALMKRWGIEVDDKVVKKKSPRDLP
ncbi:TPA: hypothetical protein DE059_04725, partial [Candidatus Peribacteria bacterium]|nr:hypothetical protein [Candidatus Peribacteria bacterium]